jgi:hypothetical protein
MESPEQDQEQVEGAPETSEPDTEPRDNPEVDEDRVEETEEELDQVSGN